MGWNHPLLPRPTSQVRTCSFPSQSLCFRQLYFVIGLRHRCRILNQNGRTFRLSFTSSVFVSNVLNLENGQISKTFRPALALVFLHHFLTENHSFRLFFQSLSAARSGHALILSTATSPRYRSNNCFERFASMRRTSLLLPFSRGMTI